MFSIVQLGFILLISACFQCRNAVASLELLDCVKEPLTVYVNKKSVHECQGVTETISQCILNVDEGSHTYEYFTMENLARIDQTCKEGSDLSDSESICNNLLSKCSIGHVKRNLRAENIHLGSFKNLLENRQSGELYYKRQGYNVVRFYYSKRLAAVTTDFVDTLPLCSDQKNVYVVGNLWLECQTRNSVVQYKNCIMSSGGGNVAYVNRGSLKSTLNTLSIYTSDQDSDVDICRKLTETERSQVDRSDYVIRTTYTEILEGRATGAALYVLNLDRTGWESATTTS